MRGLFPLFQSHLDLAHGYWSKLLVKDDIVIDATCGNGHDTLVLCKLLQHVDGGILHAIDLQPIAIKNTQALLQTAFHGSIPTFVSFHQHCHSRFPEALTEASVKLIIYNLGYLPGGDKTATSQQDTTLTSVSEALKLLVSGGCVSITCYPGHPEGAREEAALLEFAQSLPPQAWSCCHHRWLNRKQSPSLLLITKKDN